MKESYGLTAAEMALAADAEVILTKNRVIGKVYALFGALQAAMEADAVIGKFGMEGRSRRRFRAGSSTRDCRM